MIDRAAVWFDLQCAARSLLRRPGFSLTITGTLALALGALTTTMAVVDGVLLRPLPLDHPERLVVICEQHPSVRDFCVGSPPNAADWADRSRTFAAIGLARDWGFTLRQDGRQTGVRGGLASDGVFQVFGFQPVIGRTFEASDLGPGSRVTVLSHAFWVSVFGRDSNIVGRSITLDDSTWTVIGVLGPGVAIPTLADVQVWAPLPFPMRDPSQRGWRGFQVFARLREDVSRAQAAAATRGVSQVLAAEYPETNRDWGVELRTMHEQVVGEARPLLLVFLTATGLVVLVASANIASLMLARASARSRELAVQAAVGGGRERMVRVLLLESLLLAVVGTVAALAFARLALAGFLRVAPPGLPRLESIGLGWRAVSGAVMLGAGVAFLAGLPPIMRLSRLDLSTALRATGAGAGTGGSQRGRAALVIAQVAVAVTLLAGAALLTRTFRNLQGWQPGFETGHVMVAWTSLSPGRYPEGRMVSALQREVRAAVASVPGVQGAGGVSNGPLFGGEEPGTFRARDPGQHHVVTARWYDASDGYTETLGMTVSRGRAITSRDAAGSVPVAVVNETFARQMWPGEDPLGMRVALDETDAVVREVIGVVRDIPPFRAGTPPTPEIWWPFDQAPRWGAYLVVRTSNPPELLAETIRDRVLEVAPALQMGQFRTMPELIDQRLVSPRFSLTLVAGFAGLALVMAVVGLYGLVTFVVNLRQRELAIRLALGASGGAVRRAVLRQGLTLVGAGAGCGLLGALALGRVLQSLLAGVSAFDPLSFLAVTALLVGCGTLATWVPAWRASRVDPIASLRAE